MKEEDARALYWEAVHRLNDIINSGSQSKQEIIDELEDDLNE